MSYPPSTFEFAANLLAASPTFREQALGVTTPAEALERIHREEVLEEDDNNGEDPSEPGGFVLHAQRPLAIIITGDDVRSRTGVGEWAGSGSLLMVIESLVPAPYQILWAEHDAAERQRRFRLRRAWGEQLFQQLRSELMELSGRADGAGNPYLNAKSIERHLGPCDPEAGEAGDFVAFAYQIEWL